MVLPYPQGTHNLVGIQINTSSQILGRGRMHRLSTWEHRGGRDGFQLKQSEKKKKSNQKRITGLEQASDGKGGCFLQVKGTT